MRNGIFAPGIRGIAGIALVVILAGAGIIIAPKVFARIAQNTIDTTATIADNGRLIIVTGPVRNDQVEWNDQHVTVTQRTTGAVADGHTRFRGTVTEQQWEVKALVRGDNLFEPGPATAVALCVSTRHGDVTDAHQWLVNIEVVEEED
jgi:hypothetical protein